MTWKTHVVGGLIAGLSIFGACSAGHVAPSEMPLTVWKTALIFAVAAAGSLFPDIDMQTTKTGRAVKPVSKIINSAFGHRTICHAPLTYIILHLCICWIYPQITPYMCAFTVGAASHILLDMFNRAGVPLLYPLSKRFHIAGVSSSNGTSEKIFRALLCFVLVGMAALLILEKMGIIVNI